jgi:hypothetical protein
MIQILLLRKLVFRGVDTNPVPRVGKTGCNYERFNFCHAALKRKLFFLALIFTPNLAVHTQPKTINCHL